MPEEHDAPKSGSDGDKLSFSALSSDSSSNEATLASMLRVVPFVTTAMVLGNLSVRVCKQSEKSAYLLAVKQIFQNE